MRRSDWAGCCSGNSDILCLWYWGLSCCMQLKVSDALLDKLPLFLFEGELKLGSINFCPVSMTYIFWGKYEMSSVLVFPSDWIACEAAF